MIDTEEEYSESEDEHGVTTQIEAVDEEENNEDEYLVNKSRTLPP